MTAIDKSRRSAAWIESLRRRYPCSVTSLAEFCWVLSEGRVGYGMCQDNQPLRELTLRRGRRWTETRPLVD